jgi:uncharacterized protein YndB with AHSA1/START domain
VPAKPDETNAVEHTVTVAAPPEAVFEYFTDPAKMVQWMGIEATLDPQPGGVFRVDVNGAGVMLGEFVQVDPHWRIVFTCGWERDVFSVPPQSTAVEVSFTPEGEGTVVRFRHCRLPSAAAVATHRAGWEHYLGRLAMAAGGADPGPDPWLDVDLAEQAMRAAVAAAAAP